MMPRLPLVAVLGLSLGLAACSTPSRTANGRRGDQRGNGRVEQRDAGKVALCHRGKTIRVDGNAVRAHLNHGDRRGRCR